MASARLTEEATSAAWASATHDGHRVFRVAEKLLSRSWVAPCPLPVDSASQQRLSTEEVEHFTDLLVVALHWTGPPDGPPANALLAIPESASHGVTDVLPRTVECLHPDGSEAESASVVLVLASADYLAKILHGSVPADVEVTNFVTEVPTAAPSGAAIFASVPVPNVFSSGVWLHVDENAALRYSTGGSAGEEVYVSAIEDEAGLPDQPNLLLTKILGSHQSTRRAGGRARRPSVLGLSSASNAKALAAMLSVKPVPAPTPVPPKPKSVPKGNDRELLSQLLGAVTALGDRMSSLEAAQRSPPPAKASAGPVAASPFACQPIAAQPGFLPTTATGLVPVNSPHAGRPPSMIASPPPVGSSAGATAYEQASDEARRMLACPAAPRTPFREDATAGIAVPKERGADSDLRAAVMRGGADSQVAMNLAVLETLERLQDKKHSSDEDIFH
eukprot:6462641-Amphidinium_carterae.1